MIARKITALGATCAALAIAGCGGGSSDSGDSALDNALGYLPEDAPLVVSIQTDVEGDQIKAVEKLVKKLPFSGSIEDSLKEQLESQSFDFEDDLKPLLGNEFVVGATDVSALTGGDSDDQDFVGAIQTKSQDKLEEAVKREKAEEVGEKSGAKVYEDDDGDAFAVKDDVLIVAGSRQQLESALEQRDADDRLTEDTFDESTADLPKDALVRLSSDLQALIAGDPDSKDAAKVKWVGALRTLGLTASAKGDELNVDFRLTTDGEDLTDEDLPIASGDASPSVIDRAGEIGAGLRDPGQIVTFAEGALQATNPSQFGDYRTARRAIESRLDIDIDKDLLGQLKDDLSMSFAPDGKFGMRAELKDAEAFERTLAKLGKELPALLESAAGEPVRLTKRGDFNSLSTSDGKSVVYGVVDGVFVLANDPARARELGSADTQTVDGAKGSVVVSADAEELVSRAIQAQGGGLGGALGGALVAGPLGELTGSMSASPDGLVGNLKLTFD